MAMWMPCVRLPLRARKNWPIMILSRSGGCLPRMPREVIGEIVGVPETTVKGRLQQSRLRLKSILTPDEALARHYSGIGATFVAVGLDTNRRSIQCIRCRKGVI